MKPERFMVTAFARIDEATARRPAPAPVVVASAAMPAPVSRARLYAQLTVVALFWGGNFIAGRWLALQMPHFVAATARYLVAVAVLLAYLRQREGRWPRPNARQWFDIAVLGACGVFAYNAFFFGAMARISAGRAALIIGTTPALIAVAAWLVFRLRFAWWQWLGVMVALAGVAIVVARGELSALASGALGSGDRLMLGGALSMLVYTLVGRGMMGRPSALSTLAITAYACAVGLLLLAAVAAFELPQVRWSRLGALDAVAIAYLGVAGTAVSFVWFYDGVRHLGAARASVFGNLVPVFGVALAVLVLGEPLLASMVAGGLVVLAGVSLTNVERRRR